MRIRVAALLVLAPWAAECSWGGFAVTDYWMVILFLGPLYGGAAVLIREVARRTGGGWPAIVLLAAAFGIVQAALVDQSLFNQGFLAGTEFADRTQESAATWIPGLGLSAGDAVTYLGNHILLSICAPIMLVESFAPPPDRERPWLGVRGLLMIGVLYLLGSLLIFLDDESGRKGFLLTPAQAAVSVAVVITLIGAALLPGRRHPPSRPVGVPHPLQFGALVLAAHLGLWFVTGWARVAATLALAAVAVGAVTIWSRCDGWTPRHVVAGWAPGLLAAAAGAGLNPAYRPMSTTMSVISDVTVVVVALTLIVVTWRRAGVAVSAPT